MALRLALLGDICLTGKFDLEKNPEACRQFDEVRSVLAGHDFVLANLESPFTDQATSRVCKAIHIKSSSVNAGLLQSLGVSAVSLANNHIFDFGHQGYNSTIEALDNFGIKYFGTQNRQVLLERNNERLLLGGFCCLSAHPSAANSKGVNVLNYPIFKTFLGDSRAQDALPVASIHWGDENVHFPREDHIRFARLMASEQDLLLHGHHPHVVQGVEQYGRSLFAYSLGNFCTDEHVSMSVHNMVVRQTAENQKSCILSVIIEDGRICSHEIIPIADMADRLVVQGKAELDTIKVLSNQFGDPVTLSRNPSQAPTGSANGPRRFSLSWFLRRLNYHFIGAFLKGIKNRVKYQVYFSTIRKKAAEKGLH